MNTEPLKQNCSPRLSLCLLPLFLLPGFALTFWGHFFNATATGDRYAWTVFYIFLVINAPCSFGAAFGITRLYSLGFKKTLATVVIGLVLYAVSLFGSLIIDYLLFAPRC